MKKKRILAAYKHWLSLLRRVHSDGPVTVTRCDNLFISQVMTGTTNCIGLAAAIKLETAKQFPIERIAVDALVCCLPVVKIVRWRVVVVSMV